MHIVVFSITEWIMLKEQSVSLSPGASGLFETLFLKISAALVELVVTFVAFLLIIETWRTWPARPLKNFLKTSFQTHAWLLGLEGLRGYAQILLWALMLVIPGIYKWAQLFLLPYIVMLSPKYQNGEVDALEHAKRLAHFRAKEFYFSVFLFAFLALCLQGTLLFGPLREADMMIRFLFSLVFIPAGIFVHIFYSRLTLDLEKELT